MAAQRKPTDAADGDDGSSELTEEDEPTYAKPVTHAIRGTTTKCGKEGSDNEDEDGEEDEDEDEDEDEEEVNGWKAHVSDLDGSDEEDVEGEHDEQPAPGMLYI